MCLVSFFTSPYKTAVVLILTSRQLNTPGRRKRGGLKPGGREGCAKFVLSPNHAFNQRWLRVFSSIDGYSWHHLLREKAVERLHHLHRCSAVASVDIDGAVTSQIFSAVGTAAFASTIVHGEI